VATSFVNHGGLTLAKRTYVPRILGMTLGFVLVATVLYQTRAPILLWFFALFHGFTWPHLAHFLGVSAVDPVKRQIHILIADSFLAGLWLPWMSFNLVPAMCVLSSALLASMALGGWRMLFESLAASAIGALLAYLALPLFWADFVPVLLPDLPIVLATVPFIALFPLSISLVTYRLSTSLAKKNEELVMLSRIDGLSRINNRQYWEEMVRVEFERQKRSGSALSLIMLDIDHFKAINDTHGHLAGDQMIRDIASLLAGCLREADVAGRYGGEEFGLLLPDTSLAGAYIVAERIRMKVQGMVTQPHNISCTISLGVASVSADVGSYLELIRNADHALLQAKEKGRNRSVKYQSGEQR
jgi:diguanylate cyclase